MSSAISVWGMKLCNFHMLMVAACVMPQLATTTAYAVKENSNLHDAKNTAAENGAISPAWVALDVSAEVWPNAATQETIPDKQEKSKPPERKRLRCKSTKSCVSLCHRNNCNRQSQTAITSDTTTSLSNRTEDAQSIKLIALLSDETLDFLSGENHHRRCVIRTEAYQGLTIADAVSRLSEVAAQGLEPDLLIVHVGANDIVPELSSSTALVIQRLKELVDYLNELKHNSRTLRIGMSGILPRADDVSLFNRKANDVNNAIRTYAQMNGLQYMDHFKHFWRTDKFSVDLYEFDGKLNDQGMETLVQLMFNDDLCKANSIIGYRRRPSLELKDILPIDLKMYDKHLPPKYQGKATTVYFHVTVLSVDSIDEESMTYVADIFLAQSWKDFRLRLPENMTEDYRILDVDWLKYIWRPDSFFKNAKKVTFHDMSVPNHYLWLYYDKTLLYMAKLTLEMSCAMKFEFYPHDSQLCSMMIESLSHTTDDLIFVWNTTNPLVVNPDIELPQLDIIENTTEDCTLEYSTGNFTCLAVVFNLKRRVGYHLFHTYIPTTLIVVMSWISFWIRPEAIPARVTLGVTSLLTLATQNTQSQSALPPVSYVKAIDVWMSSCTVFVFMSLMEFAIVNHYMGNKEAHNKSMRSHSCDESDDKAQVHTRKVNGAGIGKTSVNLVTVNHQRCCNFDVAMTIDKFSRVFFPLSFCVLNVVYWITYAIQGEK